MNALSKPGCQISVIYYFFPIQIKFILKPNWHRRVMTGSDKNKFTVYFIQDIIYKKIKCIDVATHINSLGLFVEIYVNMFLIPDHPIAIQGEIWHDVSWISYSGLKVTPPLFCKLNDLDSTLFFQYIIKGYCSHIYFLLNELKKYLSYKDATFIVI